MELNRSRSFEIATQPPVSTNTLTVNAVNVVVVHGTIGRTPAGDSDDTRHGFPTVVFAHGTRSATRAQVTLDGLSRELLLGPAFLCCEFVQPFFLLFIKLD